MGLGRGLGLYLARQGHHILAMDLNEDNARETTTEIKSVEYLASPLARNVTGQTITIDGGWTAH